jgi:D-alanine-D-alanine ligase
VRIAFTYNLQTDASSLEQSEFDPPETVEFIFSTLERLGHEVVPLEVNGPVDRTLDSLRRCSPDLVFNTAEGQRSLAREAAFPMLFEQLELPYTGSGPHACTVTLDKYLSKCLARDAGVPTPSARLIRSTTAREPVESAHPLIVKPNFEGSSMGVSGEAVVSDRTTYRERLEAVLDAFPEGALVESFVEGIDVTVPVLEGASPATDGVLSPCSYRFGSKSPGDRSMYDYELKHERPDAVEVQVPADLPGDVRARLVEYSRTLVDVFGIRDLARLDYRVTPEGDVAFLEINALPSLEPGASLYRAATRVGLDSPAAVIGQILERALERWTLDGEAAPRSNVRTPRDPASRSTGRTDVDRGCDPVRVGLVYNRQRISGGLDDREAEFDAASTIEALGDALRSYDLDVSTIEATRGFVERINAERPDVVFNVAEGTGGRSREALVPAVLESMDLPFTGSNAGTMLSTLDKSWAKAIVARAGLSTPPCAVLSTPHDSVPPSFPLPAMVKPLAEGSSKGIDAEGIVDSREQLCEQARHVADAYPAGALVEQYLPGREFTVGLVASPIPDEGTTRSKVLPPMEIVFSEDSDARAVYSYETKLSPDRGREVRYEVPADIPMALEQKIREVARRAFEALGCRDVARIDLRLDDTGYVHFLECNALPGLVPGWSDLPMIANAAGLSYRALVGVLLAPALERMQSEGDASNSDPEQGARPLRAASPAE